MQITIRNLIFSVPLAAAFLCGVAACDNPEDEDIELRNGSGGGDGEILEGEEYQCAWVCTAGGPVNEIVCALDLPEAQLMCPDTQPGQSGCTLQGVTNTYVPCVWEEWE